MQFRMKKRICILMLEDDRADAGLIEYTLRAGGLEFSVERVESRAQFQRALEQISLDLILLDYALPSFDGFSALTLAQAKCPDIPCIFVTGTLGEEVVIEMLKSGATDYVLKTRLSRLVPAVLRSIREKEERDVRKRAEDKLRKSHEQLRALSIYLQYVREDERIRISRQVHDELGHALTGLKIDLHWLAHRLPRPYRSLLNKTRAMSSDIDTTIRTVRRIATELRPGILDDLGLVAALEWEAQEFQKRTGIQCAVSSELADVLLDQNLNTAFFRIFQETLTNIMRHARASRVEVHLKKWNGSFTLQVKDNGRGISDAEISNTKSVGLLGMRERAAQFGGELTINGIPGKGTTITVVIPVHPPGATRNHENPSRRRSRRRTPRLKANSRRRF